MGWQFVCCVMLMMTVVSGASTGKNAHTDPYQFGRSDIGIHEQRTEYLSPQYLPRIYQYQFPTNYPPLAVLPQQLMPTQLPLQPYYPYQPIGPVPYLRPTVPQYVLTSGSTYPDWSVRMRPDLLDHDHVCRVVLEHSKQMITHLFGSDAVDPDDFSYLQCKTRSELLDLQTVMTNLQSMDAIFTDLRISGFNTINRLSPLSCFGQKISSEIQTILASKPDPEEDWVPPAWCSSSGDEEHHPQPEDEENDEYIDVVKKPETRDAGYTSYRRTLGAAGSANERAAQNQKRGSFSWSWNWNSWDSGDSWNSGNSWNSWDSWDSDFYKPSRKPTYSRKKSGCKYGSCYYSHASFWEW